jgi:squalene-hopene/tetraprenyl-beta-curcumene cyclase
VDNDALFLNKIPFSDMGALCDPSWACVIRRVLEAFGILLHSPHKEKI